MFPRIFAIGTVAFWLVMTGFMVKRIHFPGSGPKNPVPVSHVMDTFFGQDRPGGQFDLLQAGSQIGIVTIMPRERRIDGETVREIVLWNAGADLKVRWNATVTLSEDSTSLAGIDLEATIAAAGIDVEIHALPDSDRMDYIVRSRGIVIADSKNDSLLGSAEEVIARSFLSQWGFSDSDGGVEGVSAGGITAYDQLLEIADRKREVYSIITSLGPEREVTAHFTKSGELLRIFTFLDFELRPTSMIDL